SHRPAALGEDMWMRQLLAIAELLEHPYYGPGVLIDVVIDGAGIARMGAVVIDAQPTAYIYMVDRQPQRTQFGVVADGFAEAGAIVGQVGDLRPHVEVQQPHPLVDIRGAEALDDRKQLRRGQTELGFLTAGIGPLARRQR